ncbi:hypothetical protein Tco_0415248 [Tanacetum coccineum]
MIPAQISAKSNSPPDEPTKEHGDRVVNWSTSKKSKRARKKHKKDGLINQAKSIVSQTVFGKSGSSTISNGKSTPNDQKQVKNIVSQTAPTKSYLSTISHGEFAPNDHKLVSNT